jgi:hypothetical protein
VNATFPYQRRAFGALLLAACTSGTPPSKDGAAVHASVRAAPSSRAVEVAPVGSVPAAGPSPCLPAGEAATSVFTELGGSACVLVSKEPTTGATSRRCPGVGGMKLLVHDDDERMSITVVTEDRKEHPLDYWHVVTPAFSQLGERAEWRVVKLRGKIVPIALIARVTSTSDADGKPVSKSYLAVSKITSSEICVTDRIDPGPHANEAARTAAETSCQRACRRAE